MWYWNVIGIGMVLVGYWYGIALPWYWYGVGTDVVWHGGGIGVGTTFACPWRGCVGMFVLLLW